MTAFYLISYFTDLFMCTSDKSQLVTAGSFTLCKKSSMAKTIIESY